MTGTAAQKPNRMKNREARNDVHIAGIPDERPDPVSRWKQRKNDPRRNKRKSLLELEYIIDQLSDIYEPNEARQWVFTRQNLLKGYSPAELIRMGKTDEVLRFANQIRDTMHS